MSNDLSALLWAFLGVGCFVISVLFGALYLRLTGLLDDTALRLQSVAESLVDHSARLIILERKQ